MTALDHIRAAKPALHLPGTVTVAAGTTWLSCATADWRVQATDFSPLARYLAAKEGLEELPDSSFPLGPATMTIADSGATISYQRNSHHLSRAQLGLLSKWSALMSGAMQAEQFLKIGALQCYCARGRVEIALAGCSLAFDQNDIPPLAAALFACSDRRGRPNFKTDSRDFQSITVCAQEGENTELSVLRGGKEVKRLSFTPVVITAFAGELLHQADLLNQQHDFFR